MIVYDVSMQISENIPVYNNNFDKKPTHIIERDFINGMGVRESRLSINLHTGTHMDAPLHMIHQGDSIASIKPEDMLHRVKVIDLVKIESEITADDLKQFEIKKGDFLIFKTRNSFNDEFDKDFVYIEKSAAEYLISKKISGVGIDSLGIERNQSGHPSHTILMHNNCFILEGLRLKDVPNGEYILVAATLNIKNAEASPVRAILIDCEWLSNFLYGSKENEND